MNKVREALEAARRELARLGGIARNDAVRVEEGLNAALHALESSVVDVVEQAEAEVKHVESRPAARKAKGKS